jgi:hypothetical protein
MNRPGFLPYFAALALISILSLGGCNSKQPAGNQPSSLPGATSSLPASGQPVPEANGAPAETNPAPGTNAAQSAPTAQPVPAVVEIPAGTRLRVRLSQSLGSKISQMGDSFGATLAEDVVADGITVIPRGARVQGKVIDAKALGHIKGAARLELRLQRVTTDRGSYAVSTSTVERMKAGKGRRSAKFIGGGGGLGALIGGLAGGGKGLVIGAAAGAGAGTAGAAFTGNKQIVLPAGTVLTFRLEQPVRVSQ